MNSFSCVSHFIYELVCFLEKNRGPYTFNEINSKFKLDIFSKEDFIESIVMNPKIEVLLDKNSVQYKPKYLGILTKEDTLQEIEKNPNGISMDGLIDSCPQSWLFINELKDDKKIFYLINENSRLRGTKEILTFPSLPPTTSTSSCTPSAGLESIILFPNNTDDINVSSELQILWKQFSTPDIGKISEELKRNKQISYYHNEFTLLPHSQVGKKKKKKSIRMVKLRNITNKHMQDDSVMIGIIGKK